MASQQQYNVASDFMRAYKDALNCVEQIAERRQSYMHYEREAGAYTQAIANNQLAVDGDNIGAGAAGAELHLVAAFEKSKALFEESNFGGVKTREDFVSKLDEAINASGNSVRLDL